MMLTNSIKPVSLLICSLLFFVCEKGLAANVNEDLMWLSYKKDSSISTDYKQFCKNIELANTAYDEVIKREFDLFFGNTFDVRPQYTSRNAKIIMKYAGGSYIVDDGFTIQCRDGKILIHSSSQSGFLYATHELIRLFRMNRIQEGFTSTENPAFRIRLLNHWDDLDGNIERGYAGGSLWKWDELPNKISSRYELYARINSSIGINAVVLNNVNADPRVLREDYLKKIAVLADIFRKYNIKVYLAANFASPLPPSATPDKMKKWGGIGNLTTADPLAPEVIKWWQDKVRQIYDIIPDFGGFLVKANSEGMPGPQDYGRSHAEGANMLARALKPYGGIVMWRAFVYQSPNADPDRMKRAYQEFMPLDGQFDDNVILQIKNGPVDFQPSEPPSTLFGAMSRTSTMAELQITQEYMGHSTYLVYLLPMWKKFLQFDTYCRGKGSTISKVLKGKVWPQNITAIAGVANTGDTDNWTGHHFAQANWYAYGRLAWNPDTSYEQITDEWILQTWNTTNYATDIIKKMMGSTWENYMKSSSPYGLGITTNVFIHYDAAFKERNGKEWLANEMGVGTNRTSSGSDFVSQYNEPNREIFDRLDLCPIEYLLCFHFVNWDYVMPSGKRFDEFFMDNLQSSIRQVETNLDLWKSIKTEIDPLKYQAVLEKLLKEQKDATTFYGEAYSFFSQYVKKK